MNRRRLPFADFRKTLEPTDRFVTAKHVIDRYGAQVPFELKNLWETDDLRMYGRGILTFVDPAEYSELFTAYNPGTEGHLVFAHNGFGELYSLHDEAVYCTLVYAGMCVKASLSLDYFGYLSLRKRSYLIEALYQPVFDEACGRIGEPAYGECLGYSPMPALGGSATPDTIIRVSAVNYLDIMNQAISAHPEDSQDGGNSQDTMD